MSKDKRDLLRVSATCKENARGSSGASTGGAVQYFLNGALNLNCIFLFARRVAEKNSEQQKGVATIFGSENWKLYC